jgi:hypothetical protein
MCSSTSPAPLFRACAGISRSRIGSKIPPFFGPKMDRGVLVHTYLLWEITSPQQRAIILEKMAAAAAADAIPAASSASIQFCQRWSVFSCSISFSGSISLERM